MHPLPVLRSALPSAHPQYSSWRVGLRYLADLKNILQAQIGLRYRIVYLPSLFGHYSVNSVCNLRCSYCYIGQPSIVPAGFTMKGLPLDRTKRVLANLRRECIALRLLGGEPLLYKDLTELVRYAKRDQRYWHVSVITNGLAFERRPGDWDALLEHLDLITVSIDRTRLDEYPAEMRRLTAFLPHLHELARASRTGLTLNYTAGWEELECPERILETISPYRPFFSSVYVVPMRESGKTPLHLLKSAVALNRSISWLKSSATEYPERENVKWYEDNCDPKLKVKIEPGGGLVYPCENHSFSAGSLETHTIRELWSAQPTTYPNESCLGCGKQRFRSDAMKHPFRSLALGRKVLQRAGSG